MNKYKTNSRSLNYAFTMTRLIVPAILILIAITLAGCNTYDNSNRCNHRQNSLQQSYGSSNYATAHEPVNPNFIFNSPKLATASTYINAENYYRTPWPTSQFAKKFVSSDEIVTYRQEIFSEQRSNSNNLPKDNFRTKTRAYRSGYLIRR